MTTLTIDATQVEITESPEAHVARFAEVKAAGRTTAEALGRLEVLLRAHASAVAAMAGEAAEEAALLAAQHDLGGEA